MRRFLLGLLVLGLIMTVSSVTMADEWWMPADFQEIDPPNPNGAWSYGWSDDLGDFYGTLKEFVEDAGAGDSPVWFVPRPGDTNPPAIWRNTSDTLYYGVEPGQVALHSGELGEAAILRWTSPIDGQIEIKGMFYAGNAIAADLYVLHKYYLGTPLFFSDDEIGDVEFKIDLDVAAGDTIDFVAAGSYANKPIIVRVVPEPTTMSLLALGGLPLIRLCRRRGTLT